MRYLIAIIVLLAALPAAADQPYRNLEVQPNGTGGYTGTYGNENFDVDTKGGVSGHVGGRRPQVVQERKSRSKGNVGATQRNCVVDSNGVAFCR
jgi:hypothetical protein